jgi:hypothetical protein
MLSGSPSGGVTSAPPLAGIGLGCDPVPGLIGFGWISLVVSPGNGNGIGLFGGGAFTPVIRFGGEPAGLGASGILTGLVGCDGACLLPPICSCIIT